MPDVVVTIPKSFGLERWIAEGDPAGTPWSGEAWHFYLGGNPPDIQPGERVYVTFNGRLRGYAPLVRIDRLGGSRYGLVRHGGAVAVTIPEYIQGFRGFRYVWWEREIEVPFPEWQNPGAIPSSNPDKSTLRAKNIPSLPPGLTLASGLDNAYELTQSIEKAIAAKQSHETPVFGNPGWISKARKR